MLPPVIAICIAAEVYNEGRLSAVKFVPLHTFEYRGLPNNIDKFLVELAGLLEFYSGGVLSGEIVQLVSNDNGIYMNNKLWRLMELVTLAAVPHRAVDPDPETNLIGEGASLDEVCLCKGLGLKLPVAADSGRWKANSLVLVHKKEKPRQEFTLATITLAA